MRFQARLEVESRLDTATRYDQKLHRILKTSSEVFAESGFDRASIRDISAATGVSLSGLYYYFSSKDELLYLIQRHCFETLTVELDSALDQISDSESKLRTVIRTHLTFFVNNMCEMKVLSHEADALSGDLRQEVSGLKRSYAERVSTVLRELSPSSDEPQIRAATYSLFGMMNWIYTWYRPGADVDVDSLAEMMSGLFLKGFPAGLSD